MELFEFYTPHGHMKIVIEEFFPAGAARIRKMVRIMKQDPRNNIPGMIKYLKKQLLLYKKDLEEHRKTSESEMFRWCHDKNALEKYIEQRRFPSGDPIKSKKDLAEMKKRLRRARDHEKGYRQSAKSLERDIKRIEKNLELLNELEE